ncbi:hypothetical protein PSE10A_32580 [Pseudomonas amygdali pv. eriobotryae]|uniref:AAA+ ATPase domain-containing protein n=1 Tax=Pseudomonas amygdali pv. eriobotryae TaxID=129137 RepID=A0A9P3AEE3_PSEA0|nr:hypothetical protein PSE10A_32580 [Pseudomonas amygdali pv. eriobotryae]
MSLAIVHSRAQVGVEAPAVTVEAHLANGLPALTLVGLPEGAVKESKDRVRSAILNSGLDFPARRITLNLAPADLPKDGGRFDLAIALGLLAASGQVPLVALQDVECLGELALSGAIRPIQGVLPAALAARAAERTLIIPAVNAEEACLASGLRVIAVNHLLELVAHFNGRTVIAPYQSSGLLHQPKPYPDLSEVQGQTAAKRALVIAAAGAHNLLFSGPPGTGKTLLASRLPGLLPPLDEHEALEVAAIQSVASQVPLTSWPQRPFRQPHHSASGPALVGGGSRPQPGEITLAHHGVLFLDELPEFDRRVLEVLREPLENGKGYSMNFKHDRFRGSQCPQHTLTSGSPLPSRVTQVVTLKPARQRHWKPFRRLLTYPLNRKISSMTVDVRLSMARMWLKAISKN